MARITSHLLILIVALTAFVQITLASNWLFGTDKGNSIPSYM